MPGGEDLRIVIVGPGALGCLLAARLHPAHRMKGKGKGQSHSVILLDHCPRRARRLNHQGIILEEDDRRWRCPVPVGADPAAPAPAELIFLCVKSPAVPAALRHCRPLLGQNSLLIALQNGIGHLAPLHDARIPFALGTTSEGATLLGPGHIRYGGAGFTFLGFPEKPLPEHSRLLQKAADLLNRAGLRTEISKNIQQRIHEKLFINVGINALTALNDITNGELLASAALRETMISAVKEAVAVTRAQGIAVTVDPVDAVLQVCRATARNTSSMLQDIRHRRPTEIDAINGAVVSAGRSLGIPTPVNRELTEKIHRLQSRFATDKNGEGQG